MPTKHATEIGILEYNVCQERNLEMAAGETRET